jgi:hypothetical protein
LVGLASDVYPAGPAAVSSGALWPSSDGKYMYQFAGEVSSDPTATPPEECLWRYDISAGAWSSISVPNNVSRPAEGASCVGSTLGTNDNGLGVYLGGILNQYSTPNWDADIPPEYLQSMILFDIVLPISPNLR